MRDFSIDLVWAKLQMTFAVIGGWLGFFLVGLDGMLIALIIFMVLDYITGLMCAVSDKKLSNEVGFKGIFKRYWFSCRLAWLTLWTCMWSALTRYCEVQWCVST